MLEHLVYGHLPTHLVTRAANKSSQSCTVRGDTVSRNVRHLALGLRAFSGHCIKYYEGPLTALLVTALLVHSVLDVTS